MFLKSFLYDNYYYQLIFIDENLIKTAFSKITFCRYHFHFRNRKVESFMSDILKIQKAMCVQIINLT